MALELTRYRFTIDDYHRMGEAGILGEDDRVELIDGEILQMSPIGRRHVAGVNRLTHLFVSRLGERAIVSIQNPIQLPNYSEPRPDLTILRPRADFYADADSTPETVLLVVEIADSSIEYDRRIKAPLYARSGIPEYWILDVGPGGLPDRPSRPDKYRLRDDARTTPRGGDCPVRLPRPADHRRRDPRLTDNCPRPAVTAPRGAWADPAGWQGKVLR